MFVSVTQAKLVSCLINVSISSKFQHPPGQTLGIWQNPLPRGREFDVRQCPGGRAFEQTTKLYDFVYIKLFCEKWHLVHVIQYNVVSCVLIEVFNSILIILKTKTVLRVKRTTVKLNEEISTNLFCFVPVTGTFQHKSFHMARHSNSNLIPGRGTWPKAISKVQIPGDGPGWDVEVSK